MVDFDVKDVQLNTQSSNAGNVPVPASSAALQPKTIFAGMTETQAKEYGLLDEYNKANTDGEAGISEEEFNAYQKNQNQSAETSQGNVYMVKKGDTLSKIAQKWGTTVAAIAETNGIKDVNLISIGQSLKMPAGAQLNTSDLNGTISKKTTNNNAQIFIGMTREQAKKAGVEDVFHQYAGGEDTISRMAFQTYTKSRIPALTAEQRERLKNFDINNTEDLELFHQMVNQHTDKSAIIEKYKNATARAVLEDMFNNGTLSVSDLEAAGLGSEEQIKQNPKAFGEFLYAQIKKSYDSEIANKDGGDYKENYERLRRGEYTDYERETLGLSEAAGELSEEQLQEFTEQAIRRKYQATIAQISINTADDDKAHYTAAMVQGMSEAFLEDNPNLKAALVSYNLLKLERTEYAEPTAQMVAANTKAYGVYEGDEASSILATKAILQTGNAATVEQLLQNNPEQAEIIRDVAAVVLANTTDSAKVSALKTVISNAEQIIANGTTGAESTKSARVDTSHSAAQPAASTSQVENESAAMPQYSDDPRTSAIDDIKRAAQNYTSNPIGSSTSGTGSLIDTDIASVLNIDSTKLKNMSSADALEIIAANFDNLPEIYQKKVRVRLSGASPISLCECYINGSNPVRKFLSEGRYISRSTLSAYYQKYPQAYSEAPPEIKDMIEEYRERTMASYDNATFTDNWHTYSHA
ncbi:MAG: LysM peptidoglycan-binding domain-containing protein [Candidatus Gastranaerophilales bacterium]|nr:LysM peptidoglycan-binding domain-containing protein [Candidatus Gastranaerophilales bacterium]